MSLYFEGTAAITAVAWMNSLWMNYRPIGLSYLYRQLSSKNFVRCRFMKCFFQVIDLQAYVVTRKVESCCFLKYRLAYM